MTTTYTIIHTDIAGQYINNRVPEHIRIKLGVIMSQADEKTALQLLSAVYHDRQSGNCYKIKRV